MPSFARRASSTSLRNATDACQSGGTLGLRLAPHDNALRLTVWDDGPGLSPSVAAALWHEPVSTKKHGGGMGLLLVAMIVEHIHGGRVGHTARDPHGCCFHLDLPTQSSSPISS